MSSRAYCARPGCSRSITLCTQHSRRSVRARSDASESVQERRERFKSYFSEKRSSPPLVEAVSKVPSTALTAGTAGLAAVAAFLGYSGAKRAPLEGAPAHAVQIAATVALGGAVAAGGVKAKKLRGTGAGTEFWNALVDAEDPSDPDPQIAANVRQRFGESPEMLEGIKQAYFSYLLALIPPGNVTLAGDEHIKARQFLDAIGLPDEDAAPVHIDVGRTLFRQNLEASERDSQVEGVKAFQKLVYVSSQLFGDLKSGHLTPWVARFKGVTPEQVAIAKRNGARMIFQGRLNGDHGGVIPANAEALASLANIQKNTGLSDDACATVVRELLAADTEGSIAAALEDLKTRGSEGQAQVVKTVDTMLARSRVLAELGAQDDALPGVGALTVKGTKFASGHNNELVDIYTTYMKRKMADAGNSLTPDAIAQLQQLADVLALPAGRLEDSRAKIVSDAYARALREAVTSGRMDAAESPAKELNALIAQVQMPGEQALAMHEDFYKAKLRDCLADNKIDDADAKALERTARLLCLSAETVSRCDVQQKGDVMRETLGKVLDLDVERFDSDDAKRVARDKVNLRLTGQQAMEILKEVGRGRLVSKINAARNASNVVENAKVLKRVVFFSNIILKALITAVKTAPEPSGAEDEQAKEDAMKEIAETIAKARAAAAEEEAAEAKRKEEAPSGGSASADSADLEDGTDVLAQPDAEDSSQASEEATTTQVLETAEGKPVAASGEETTSDDTAAKPAEKAEAAKERGQSKAEEAQKQAQETGQKEITVGDEAFDKQGKLDIYKGYLEYCMRGDVILLPMGGYMTVERDQSEFTRLQQLGDILGLTAMDIMPLHNDMAEEAFKAQAEALAPGGDLSPEAAAQLSEMSEKMGLSQEKAQKIIRGITNKKLVGNLQDLQSSGQLTLARILDLADQDVDVTGVVGEGMRMQLFEQHVNEQLSSGNGNVDPEELMQRIPEKLQIDVEKAKKRVSSRAQDKMRPMLVQALAFQRTNDHSAAVKYMHNLVSCARLHSDASSSLKWDNKKELSDMYGLFCTSAQDAGERSELGSLFGLSEDEQQSLQKAADSGELAAGKNMATQKRENESFF